MGIDDKLKLEIYDYKTFGELVSEVLFDYEIRHEPEISMEGEIKWVTFYKTSFSNEGEINRKGNSNSFDPKLFWKVEMLAKLLMNDSTIEVLYGTK